MLHASGAHLGWDIIISRGPQLAPFTVQEVIIFGPDCNPKNMMEYPQRILEKVKVNHDKTDRGRILEKEKKRINLDTQTLFRY